VLSVSDRTPINFLLGRGGGFVQDIFYVPYSQPSVQELKTRIKEACAKTVEFLCNVRQTHEYQFAVSLATRSPDFGLY